MTGEADHITLTLAPNDTTSSTNSIAGNRKSLRRVSSAGCLLFLFLALLKEFKSPCPNFMFCYCPFV